MTKRFRVAKILDYPYLAKSRSQYVLIAEDAECYHVIRRKDQVYPAPWKVGDEIEVEMKYVCSGGSEGTVLAPMWRRVGGELPLKYSVHSPYDAVLMTWGEEAAKRLGQRPRRPRQSKEKQQTELPLPAKVYSRRFVCWFTTCIDYEDTVTNFHLMATSDGEAWDVRRSSSVQDEQPIWQEGEIVSVRMRLAVDAVTGDRWMEPDWNVFAAQGVQTTLSPLHLAVVSQFFQSAGEKKKKKK